MTVEVYLVRHGEAMSEEEDPTRPLSDKGQEDIRRVAERTKELGLDVSGIYHSGKLRAEQTAEILAEHLGPIAGTREREGLKPLDDPSIMESEINAAGKPFMIVGHLPYLSHLASALISGDPEKDVVEFASGAVVALSKTDALWEVEWIITPKMLS